MKTVKVILNPKSGQLFTENEAKPDYGFITLQETAPRVNMESGVAKVNKPRTALMTFKKSDWENVKSLFSVGSEHEGQIIIEESTERKGQISPATAGAGGAELKHNGSNIYRYPKFTSNQDAQDLILSRDKVGAGVVQAATAAENSGLA